MEGLPNITQYGIFVADEVKSDPCKKLCNVVQPTSSPPIVFASFREGLDLD